MFASATTRVDLLVDCNDIAIVANLWRGKWAVIRGGNHTPPELTRKLADLHVIERHIAELARSRPLELADIRTITDVQLEILTDELRSEVIGRAI